MYQNNTQSNTYTCGHAKESHSTHGECGTMMSTGGIPDVCPCAQYQALTVSDATIAGLQARIAELETQLQGVTRYFANESLANENTTLKQRISELEADAAFCEQILELKSTAEGRTRIIYFDGTSIFQVTKPTFREAVTAARAESENQTQS